MHSVVFISSILACIVDGQLHKPCFRIREPVAKTENNTTNNQPVRSGTVKHDTYCSSLSILQSINPSSTYHTNEDSDSNGNTIVRRVEQKLCQKEKKTRWEKQFHRHSTLSVCLSAVQKPTCVSKWSLGGRSFKKPAHFSEALCILGGAVDICRRATWVPAERKRVDREAKSAMVVTTKNTMREFVGTAIWLYFPVLVVGTHCRENRTVHRTALLHCETFASRMYSSYRVGDGLDTARSDGVRMRTLPFCVRISRSFKRLRPLFNRVGAPTARP